MKFKVSKVQQKLVKKWLKTEPSHDVRLNYCFSISSGIGVALVVVNTTTGNFINVTEYSTW